MSVQGSDGYGGDVLRVGYTSKLNYLSNKANVKMCNIRHNVLPYIQICKYK